MTTNWMIYGANGYTGRLIAHEAVRRGMTPVLAGRHRAAVEALAQTLGLPSRVFDLGDAAAVARELDGHALVLHAAGPFSATARTMMAACLQARTHYLDITGEIDVFEHAHALDADARAAGIALCPGVGFDVIPTDCIAAALKRAMPDATHLALGFDSGSRFSPGTAKTVAEGLPHGVQVRRNGRLVTVPFAWKVRRIDFGDGEKPAMTIPWGDVATAWQTTGIPNIEVYMPAEPRAIAMARHANWVRPLLGIPTVQRWLKARIARTVRGPDEAQRDAAPTFVWGEATDAAGRRKTARIRTANGYSLTATGSLTVAQHLLSHTAAGSFTPSRLCGADLVERLPGSGRLRIDGLPPQDKGPGATVTSTKV